MGQDELPDPIDVSLHGPDAEALPPTDVAGVIEQPGLDSEACPCRVSLREGARLCTIPCVVKAL